jgi:hypothetical protein
MFLEDLVAAGDMAALTRMLLHILGLHQEAKRLGIAAEHEPG